MSRVGNNPIIIPEGVDVSIGDEIVTVKGKLGELVQKINPAIQIDITDNIITLKRSSHQKEFRSMHGLYRALIANMIEGTSKGFTKKLQFNGVGYRASTQGQILDISVGFSHNIMVEIPSEVKVEAETEKGKSPIVTLTSYDKQLLGSVAAKIRSFRPPEPYKGKGIRYIDEYVRRKAGKTAAS
mgnify:CR=1 FL=1|tara:strand:- start:4514 stop:5065 length:552 start_codon:yes stop_codon:yes gene_type:complete